MVILDADWLRFAQELVRKLFPELEGIHCLRLSMSKMEPRDKKGISLPSHTGVSCFLFLEDRIRQICLDSSRASLVSSGMRILG